MTTPIGWARVGEMTATCFRTESLVRGARLAAAIAALGDDDPALGDDVALDLRRDGVTVRLSGQDRQDGQDGQDGRDRQDGLADRISAVAREMGVPADPSAVQNLVVTIDALAPAAVVPFWQAVLGYRVAVPGEELADPHRRGPVFYVNRMDAPRPQRNRVHIDVWVPRDQVRERVAAALAAGGRLVTGEHAPAWWVLADPEGNEACVATV
jgi:4a-hydroxytetrahydrobiopterin dehydratase